MFKRKNNKKGFTIVELTIVVAVIAILSAVLIPTFAGITKKARQTSDETAVRNMNTVIATIADDNLTYNDIAEKLDEEGYNVMNKESWNPSYKGYVAYWLQAENAIVLVDTKTNKIVFPTNLAGDFSANVAIPVKGSSYYKQSVATTTEAAIADIESAITNGTSISLTSALTLSEVNAIQIPKDAEITVDLAGSTLSSNERNPDVDHQYAFDVKGDLTIKNAIIEARGVQVYKDGTLILGEDVVVKAVDSNGGAAVYVYEGGNVIINNGSYSNTAVVDEEMSGATAVISYGNLTINGGTFTTVAGVYAVCIYGGKATISNATISGARGGIAVNGKDTEVTIKNSTVTSNWTQNTSCYALWVGAGKVTVDGGEFRTANAANALCNEDGTVTELNNPVWTSNWVAPVE